MVGVVMLDNEAGIFLGQPLQRARQLDIVLAVGGFNGDRTIAGGIFDVDGRRQLARAEGPGDHRALGMRPGLLGGELAATNELGDERVVLGQLLELAVPDQVCA